MNYIEKFLIYLVVTACVVNFTLILSEHFAFGFFHHHISGFHETTAFYNWTTGSQIAATILPVSSRLYGMLNIENNIFSLNDLLCFRQKSSYEHDNNCRISLSYCYAQNNSTRQYIEIRQHESYTRREKTRIMRAEYFDFNLDVENLKSILYSTDDYSKMEWNGCNCYYFLTGNGINKYEASFCNEYGLNITRSLIVSSDDKNKYNNDFNVCDGRMCSKIEMVTNLNRYIFSLDK